MLSFFEKIQDMQKIQTLSGKLSWSHFWNYLRWLEKNEKNEGEESPLGIILCADKSQETVELLELDKSGIHVAQYLTQMPPKNVIEEKLYKAIEQAKIRLFSNE